LEKGWFKVAENNAEVTVKVEEGAEKERIGIFAAIAYVIYAIGLNIKAAGPTEVTNMFRVLFRSFLAIVMVSVGIAFLWKAAFIQKALLNEHTGVIVGFITGTFITAAISFYFGGQDRSKKSGGDDTETK
jgi:hypothetical protein